MNKNGDPKLVELSAEETMEILSQVDSVSMSNQLQAEMEDVYCNYLYTKNDILKLTKEVYEKKNFDHVIEQFKTCHTRRNGTNKFLSKNLYNEFLARLRVEDVLCTNSVPYTSESLDEATCEYIRSNISKNLCKVLESPEVVNVSTDDLTLNYAINSIMNEEIIPFLKKDVDGDIISLSEIEKIKPEDIDVEETSVIESKHYEHDVINPASEEVQNQFYNTVKEAYVRATNEQRTDIDKYIISKSSSEELTDSSIGQYLNKLDEIVGTSQPEMVVDAINNNTKRRNGRRDYKKSKTKEKEVIKNPETVTESDVTNLVDFPPVVSLSQSAAPRKISSNNDITNHVEKNPNCNCGHDHNNQKLDDMVVTTQKESSQPIQNESPAPKIPKPIKMVGIGCDPVTMDGYYQTGLECSDNPMILSVIGDEFVEVPGTPETKSAIIIGQIIRCTLSSEEYYSFINNGFKFHFDCGLSNKIITGYAVDPSGAPHTEMYHVEIKDYTSDFQMITVNVYGDSRTNLV